MGGSGSGNRCRWGKQTTIDETKRIDIRYMKKRGMLKPGYGGTLNWSRGGKPAGDIRYQCFDRMLKLDFRFRSGDDDWQPVKQNIFFDRTPCNYGGERLWFLCPRCSKRVGILCSDGPLFLCRHCYQLPYASQQQSRMDRLIDQKHKLGERIFEHYDSGEGWGKKKGMHWKTFNPLHARYKAMEQQWLRHMAVYLRLL